MPLSCKKERETDLGFSFCKSEAIFIFYISPYLNQIKSNQIKSNQIKSNQIKSNQITNKKYSTQYT